MSTPCVASTVASSTASVLAIFASAVTSRVTPSISAARNAVSRLAKPLTSQNANASAANAPMNDGTR